MPLSALHDPSVQIKVTGISTFYLAPKDAVEADPVMLQRLGLLKKGETLKPASSPLREIGRYGPREMKAFQAYAKFKVPRDYHLQEEVAASRFLIRLRQDLALQDLYRRDPEKAVSPSIFPGLSERERSLLATRDAGAIQIAAKGSAKRSIANQHFLQDFVSNRRLAASLLQYMRHRQPISQHLLDWAKEKNYTLEIENMRSDINLFEREQLMPWGGVYLNAATQQIITLLPSRSGIRNSLLLIDTKAIKGFRFTHGVLQWQAKKGNANQGFLRFDVDHLGKRRLLGNIWSVAESQTSLSTMVWHEVDPIRNHPSRYIGRYRQTQGERQHVLQLSCAVNQAQGRYLQASLDGKELHGEITFNGRSLIVGSNHFELAVGPLHSTEAWHAETTLAESFNGRYVLRLTKHLSQTTLQLDINKQTVCINGCQVSATFPTAHRLRWQDGPEIAPGGELHLLFDPITLLPEVFGAIHHSSGQNIACHGMIAASTEILAERPRADFALPLPAWQTLLTLSANASRAGGLLLWHKWEKAQYVAHILNTHLRQMAR
jgi:hypothetical protein